MDGIVPHAGDEVNVVGHDDEPASEPVVAGGAVEQKCNKTFKGRFVIEDADAAINAGSQEVRDVAVAIGPNAVEAAEAAGDGFAG